MLRSLAAIIWISFFAMVIPGRGASLPAGFMEVEIGGTWSAPVGLAFGTNRDGTRERIYVWEQAGKVWIVENGVRLPVPMIDLSEEVGAWRHYGLLGVALDPAFRQNGYLYLFYVVDRHHLLHFGTPSYNPQANSYFQPSIGRITRYTARAEDDFRTVDPASRKILLGATKSTGIPVMHQSHGVGHLAFAPDGTLLASTGDGASYEGADNGGNAGGSWGDQAVADGIIPPEQNVGSFRCLQLDSLSGKLLRIDPATGHGVPGNPYYEPARPDSVRSRVWSFGLRNPFRFCVKPGTGSTDRAAAQPGTILIGDVGWLTWEELNIADAPGQNFGWPLYEGMDREEYYWAVKPAQISAVNPVRPRCDWLHNTGYARVLAGGNVAIAGSSAAPGVEPFGGNSSLGGTFQTGSDFPAAWRGYFHGDSAANWIKRFEFNDRNEVIAARTFATGEGFAFLASHPRTGGLYYANVFSGKVRRISHAPGGNPAPALENPGERTWFRGQPVSIPVIARDSAGDTLAFAAAGLPPSLTIHPQTGVISGTPSRYDPPSGAATVTVVDSAMQTASATFAWYVTGTENGLGGLRAEYFPNHNLSGTPVLRRLDPGIAFEWQGASPGPGLPADDFSARWSGEILPLHSEPTTFIAAADDGLRLWIDGRLIIDQWQRGTSGTWEATVPLIANRPTPIRVEYLEGGGWASARLAWRSPSLGWQTIPAARLVPAPDLTGTASVFATQRIERNAGDLDFIYDRPATLQQTVIPRVQASTDLLAWRDVTEYTTITPLNPSTERVRLPQLLARSAVYGSPDPATATTSPRLWLRVSFVSP